MKRFIKVSVVFLYLALVQATAWAQGDSTAVEKDIRNIYKGKAYRAVSVHADIFSPFMGRIANKNINTFEFQADINLYDKLFPTVEAGLGNISVNLAGGQGYRASAPFVRLGMNYNLLNNATKEGTPRLIRSYPFLGVRYGIGVVDYAMTNVKYNSDYWQGSKTHDFAAKSTYAGWIEIVGGIRVDIYRGLTMGWSVRLKTAFHAKNKTQLWWTPGYGFTQGAQFAFNYTLGYTLRTKAERAKTAAQTDRK